MGSEYLVPVSVEHFYTVITIMGTALGFVTRFILKRMLKGEAACQKDLAQTRAELSDVYKYLLTHRDREIKERLPDRRRVMRRAMDRREAGKYYPGKDRRQFIERRIK